MVLVGYIVFLYAGIRYCDADICKKICDAISWLQYSLIKLDLGFILYVAKLTGSLGRRRRRR